MSAPHYDVAVIGAGPAGSAAAYFLARGGLRVALLDKFDFPRDKTCGDGLTPRTLEVLNSMGVLPQVEQYAYPCVALTVRNSDEVTYRIELSGPTTRLAAFSSFPASGSTISCASMLSKLARSSSRTPKSRI